jgi:hypothetical protein
LPRHLSRFACFAYFAVPSAFYIGTVLEPPCFSRSSLRFAIVGRGFGRGRICRGMLAASFRLGRATPGLNLAAADDKKGQALRNPGGGDSAGLA